MLLDIKFWILFIVLLGFAFGIQQVIFLLANKKENRTKKGKDGIN